MRSLFPNVLSKSGPHSALNIRTLDFIQLQFAVNWT